MHYLKKNLRQKDHKLSMEHWHNTTVIPSSGFISITSIGQTCTYTVQKYTTHLIKFYYVHIVRICVEIEISCDHGRYLFNFWPKCGITWVRSSSQISQRYSFFLPKKICRDTWALYVVDAHIRLWSFKSSTKSRPSIGPIQLKHSVE